jgi:hypothetical protein
MASMAIAASTGRSTYGFRRVDRVHIYVDRAGHASADVTGVLHRYPRTVPVPLRVANQLVLDGAPLDLEVAEDGEDQANSVDARTPA